MSKPLGHSVMVVCVALLSPMLTSAQQATPLDAKTIERVMDNVSHQYTVCAAYYIIVANGVRLSGSEQGGIQYDEIADEALELAVASAQVKRTADMAFKVVKARLEIENKAMLSEIENDNANISLLNVKHLESCRSAMLDSEALIDSWIRKTQDLQKQ